MQDFINMFVVQSIPHICHFFIKFTPKKRVNYGKIHSKLPICLRYYGKIHSKLPIFHVKSVQIYTGQKNLHENSRGSRDKYEVWCWRCWSTSSERRWLPTRWCRLMFIKTTHLRCIDNSIVLKLLTVIVMVTSSGSWWKRGRAYSDWCRLPIISQRIVYFFPYRNIFHKSNGWGWVGVGCVGTKGTNCKNDFLVF